MNSKGVCVCTKGEEDVDPCSSQPTTTVAPKTTAKIACDCPEYADPVCGTYVQILSRGGGSNRVCGACTLCRGVVGVADES